MKIHTLTQTALLCAAGATLVAVPATGFAHSHNAARAIAVDNEEHVKGTIVKVDLSNETFTLRTREGKSIEISINSETQYTLNGKEATAEQALKQGATATVRHENKTATRVESTIES